MYQNYLINSKLPLNVADAQIVGGGGGGGGGRGRSPLPLFENRKIRPDVAKSSLFVEKVLFLCASMGQILI